MVVSYGCVEVTIDGIAEIFVEPVYQVDGEFVRCVRIITKDAGEFLLVLRARSKKALNLRRGKLDWLIPKVYKG